jgi:hypothetical protein
MNKHFITGFKKTTKILALWWLNKENHNIFGSVILGLELKAWCELSKHSMKLYLSPQILIF